MCARNLIEPAVTESFISVGRITGVFGHQGWIKVITYSGIVDRFKDVKVVYLEDDGAYSGNILDDYRIHSNSVLLKFKQIDNRETARSLIGQEIYLRDVVSRWKS